MTTGAGSPVVDPEALLDVSKTLVHRFGALSTEEIGRLPSESRSAVAFIIVKTLLAREPVRVEPKTGRNEPRPCGSGKKFKTCHG